MSSAGPGRTSGCRTRESTRACRICRLFLDRIQKPHPPIRIAANSPETYTIAGRLGLPIFATPLIAGSMDKLREYIGTYRDSLPAGVTQDVAVAFTVHVSASQAQARRECEASLMHFFSFLEQRRPDIQALPESYQSLQKAVDPTQGDYLRGAGRPGSGPWRPGALRRAGPGPATRIPDERVYLLLQPGGPG